MSHFTVMVIGEDYEKLLAPFNENIEYTPYIEYTKEERILKFREEIEGYKNGTYAKFLEDPKKYLSDSREGHANYIQNVFPRKMKMSDEELLISETYDSDDVDSMGNQWTTYNPNSKWDWHLLGGRWSGMIKLKEGRTGNHGQRPMIMQEEESGIDQAIKTDIENWKDLKAFAFLMNGKWSENGKMGWFASVIEENENWDEDFEKLKELVPDDALVSIVDCHI